MRPLAAIEAAVTVHRRLAAADPDAVEPDVAGALHNLSNRLAEATRHDEAEHARAEVPALESRR